MIRPIAIIDHDEELKIINQELDVHLNHFNQRREFLNKQINDIDEELKKSVVPIVSKMSESLIRSKKMPTEFDPKIHHLHLDDGVILLCDGGHGVPVDNQLKI